jgi:hypothetical protein
MFMAVKIIVLFSVKGVSSSPPNPLTPPWSSSGWVGVICTEKGLYAYHMFKTQTGLN